VADPWTTEIDWHLTNRCNFDCEYCFPQIRWVLNRTDLDEPSPAEVARAFDRFDGPCLIHMSGGEPFLFPGFVELCRRLTVDHTISINTNLSATDVIHDFSGAVPPGQVRQITAAIHVRESERVGRTFEDYAANVHRLRQAGFSVDPLYVLHPTLIRRVEDDVARLSDLGIRDTGVKVFKGVWEGKEYPEAYRDTERELLVRLGGSYGYTADYLAGIRKTFRGTPCTAGATSFKVTVRGDVQRCATVPASYGNIFDGTFQGAPGPRPCTARRVKVVSQCLRYSHGGQVPATSELAQTETAVAIEAADREPEAPPAASDDYQIQDPEEKTSR
jgi:MoaA/NifB/PqqE/SkfB family radical SAM enzyme